ncbi:hypothetical protein IPG41_04130 [Candidatus Peregrinibacteria bacterium]|nr:MAG: hypothetical protein IPG41_04130 [Candidatus Peregrinibacteria bacterium]
MKPTRFIFEEAAFSPKERWARFSYSLTFADGKPLHFNETLQFPAGKTQKVPGALLKELLKNLHLVLGLSYYKLYCPAKIQMPYQLSPDEAHFWETLYRKGLGEFFYRNHVDFRKLLRFPSSKKARPFMPVPLPTKEHALLGIGGGKDSIVAGEFLKKRKIPLKGFVLETGPSSPVVSAVMKAMKIQPFVVQRRLDPKVFQSLPDALNGHIPISAIFAFTGLFAAALYGYRYTVVANEASSNQGNLTYLGESINHQWSKSAEFEAALQEHFRLRLSPSLTYFSAIRHFYEIRVVEEFVKHPKYFPLFTSCNRSFRIEKVRPKTLWCGECAKCTFVFAELAAFLKPAELLPIFGKNLFEEEALLPLFKDLCGLGKMKPFDCVGTFEESRAALRLAQKNWAKTVAIQTLLPLLKKHFPKDKDEALFKVQNAPTLPAHLKFLGLKNVLLLGYGKEGKSSEKYLKNSTLASPFSLQTKPKIPIICASKKPPILSSKHPGYPRPKSLCLTLPRRKCSLLTIKNPPWESRAAKAKAPRRRSFHIS